MYQNRTWFDRVIYDREYHRLLKPRHPKSWVAYTLPINIYLMFAVAIAVGVALGLA